MTTAYTWDADNYNLKKETKKLSVQECAQQINAIESTLLVISGGEPLLQQEALDDLFPRMPAFVMGDLKVEVETNGTIVPMWPPNTFQLRFNVSPKLSHADDGRDPYSKRVIPSVLEELGKRWDCRFKFVVSDPSDEYEILDIVKGCGLNGDHVWLMPLGTEVEQLNQSLQVASEIAVRNKWNVTDRMHIRIWDGKRGH